MQYSVKFSAWNGQVGKNADFEPITVVEVLDTQAVYPVPDPLFDTEDQARAWGEANFPAHVASELHRLREVHEGNYRESAGQALREYHAHIKSSDAALKGGGKPAVDPPPLDK